MISNATPKLISLRLMVDQESRRVIFAEAGKEFVDVLLSFLTLPLGTIARLVSKDSNLKAVRFGCISSLYESVGNIDQEYFFTNTCKEMLLQPRNPMEAHCSGCLNKMYTSLFDLNGKYFKSEEVKSMLINPGVDSKYKVNPGIMNIKEATHPEYSCYTKIFGSSFHSYLTAPRSYSDSSYCPKSITVEVYSPVTFLDHKSLMKEKSNDGVFVKGASMFMVTDELVVKPFSFISAVSYLNESYVGNYDLEERIICIGVKEVKAILKASMISSSALTIGLAPFLMKYQRREIAFECPPHLVNTL